MYLEYVYLPMFYKLNTYEFSLRLVQKLQPPGNP